MTDINYFVLSTDRARQAAAARCLAAPEKYQVMLKPAKRSDEQNALMWVKLTDLAEQVPWPIWMGTGFVDQLISKEDWKAILTAGLKSSQRMAKAVEGEGFVALGEPTSRMTIAEMKELIDFAEFVGDSRGVEWTPDPHPERRK